MFFVYRHIRLDTNQPFYIGIGTKPKRFSSHKVEYRRAFSKDGRNTIWKGITSRSDYKIEIIFESDSYSNILEKEKEFIKLYGRISNGTGTLSNLTDGGEGGLGVYPSELTRQKLSLAKKGISLSKEHTEKISKANKGKKRSLDYIICMKERLTGKRNLKKSKQMRSQGKTILDLYTGVFFDSLIDACESTNSKYKSALDKLYNKSKNSRFIRAY